MAAVSCELAGKVAVEHGDGAASSLAKERE